MTAVVIVGAGIAGITAAETLRAEGFSGTVTVLGAEDAHPYRRPTVSKDLLLGTSTAAKVALRAAEYWSERDIEVRTAVAVDAIDVGGRAVRLSTGERLPFDALLLATGARARTLEHDAGEAALSLRSLADVTPLRAAIDRGDGVLVVGAGLIGSEVAAAARELGTAVTMLESAPAPLHRVLPPQVGELYARMHRDRGVALHTSVRLAALTSHGDGAVLARADDGRTWTAGTALLAVGSVPETRLAEAAGLTVDDGIVVDEQFRTSAPGVFAAGDVANRRCRFRGERGRTEHWSSAQAHGAAAARSMLAGLSGAVTPVWSEVPMCWSSQYGRNLQIAGWPGADDEVEVHGDVDAFDFIALTRRGDRLVGAVAIGRPKELREARTLIGQAWEFDASRA
ncbi:NAD(P)/FAD-dependent oxidoreductase [Rhodococcus sp. NPDC127528]|uniref:NAD(P)/FAD-dependent oxidoreductase n=1 Tax=unclassified Rhodococcus (in: high G+C Gram-positive bacteria) TaxID=192944 RepID=UPI003632913D